MSFLYPAFLIGALAVAVPIVLHLLRRDAAPEVPFTAVRLLKGSPVETSRRRRIRDRLLLAARVAALLLLAGAFARPYLTGAAGGGTTVVAVDRSLSMGAPGQFARALEIAHVAIDEAPASHQVVAVAFDERAAILAPPGSRADARAALDGVAPGFGATRYARLAETIAELPPGADGRLVIVTDLQRVGWSDSGGVTLPPGWRIDVRDAGRPDGNLAVTALAVEPGRVEATVRNAWAEAREGTLAVLHDEREIGASRFTVAAGTTIDVAVSVSMPSGGALAVRLDDPGGLPGDDVRYHALGGVRPRVLVVGPDIAGRQAAFYVARALETAQGAGGFDVEAASGAAVSKLPAGSLAARGIILLTSTRGLDRRARDAMVRWTRDGGGLWLAASPGLEGSVLSTMFGWDPALSPTEIERSGMTFAATDPRHPIFRPFGPLLANLGRVRIGRAWRVDEQGWAVLARFSDGSPALLERAEAAGRVVLFASDLDRAWNDFPLHPSFVPFAIETARYLVGNGTAGLDRLVGEAPSGLPDRPGVYPFGTSGGAIALNVDPRESEADTLDMDEFAARFEAADPPSGPAARLQRHQLESAQSYWRYGVMLMLAVLVLESVIGKAR